MLDSCPYLRYNPFVRVSTKYGSSTVVGFNGTLAEDKMRRFKGVCAHLYFNKGPIYTHDGASARFSTHSHQCCGSGMFIPDPDFYPSRIPIQKQQQKRGVKKFVFLVATKNITKLKIVLFFKC
jgi:hypothetical protein